MNKKLLLIFSVFALLVGTTKFVKAENSADAYSPNARSYQIFVDVYNTDGATIPVNSPVILAVDSSQTVGASGGGTLGAYIRSTTTTDSIFAYGVTDEAISAGTMGRVCIRGPHKIAAVNALTGQATGSIFSSSTTQYKAGIYATADGTAGGQLGILLSTTATSDTGDASNTFWAWLFPQFHK